MNAIPIAEARSNLSALVDEAVRTHQRTEITRNGRPAAVLMSVDDLDSLLETLDLLSDEEAMAAFTAAKAEVAAGDVFTLDEVTASMRASGRLT
jgi:prevent-host-death family protein